MKTLISSFFIFFLIFFQLKADSSIIYKDGYKNPLNVLNSFLWNEDEKGKIGLISSILVKNRDLKATVHPILIEPHKIKIALNKIRYKDEDKELDDLIFKDENLEIISKYASKGLYLANKKQDVIFQFANKDNKKNITQGIIFAQKKSLNFIFFQINDCQTEFKSKKKYTKKKKEFYKNHPNFSFKKKESKCDRKSKTISVTSSEGIYKRNTNNDYSWIIFTSKSWGSK